VSAARALHTAPVVVPTLDELAADPARASTLPPATLQALLCRLATVQGVLFGALLTATAHVSTAVPQEPDRLLDVQEAAERLGVSTDWLYRHARRLPFVVRNGRLLRFSSQGIDRFIKTRQGRAG